jgi:glycosyltransferase involved in cell wall biosynthesis
MLDPWFKRTYPLKHLKKWLYWPWGEYRVLRHARAVCFTCEEERRLARQSFWLYNCRERVINYGTAAPDGDPEGQKEIFLTHFPELRGKSVWLFLGRLHPKKGCDLLLRALARIARWPEAAYTHLVMAGPDQTGWLAELRKLAAQLGIAHRITWSGMLRGDLKAGALRAAEVFVLPSHQENFGIAVVEALACGVPVLISNKVNIWREIEQDNAGLVDNDDEGGVTRLLSRWLQLDPRQRDACRAAATRCFLQRFEIHKAADTLLQVLANTPAQ